MLLNSPNKFIVILVALSGLLLGCTQKSAELTQDNLAVNYLHSICPYKDDPADLSKKEIQHILTLTNTSLHRKQIMALVDRLGHSNDTTTFNLLTDKALVYAQQADDLLYKAQVYIYIANFKASNNQFTQAFLYSNLAREYYLSQNNLDKIAQIDCLQGFLLFERGLVSEAQEKAQSALSNLAQNQGQNYTQTRVYELLGYCMITKENYQRAFDYFSAQLNTLYHLKEVHPTTQVDFSIMMCLGNIALVNFKLQQYENALKYANQGLELLQKHHYPLLESYLSTTKARTDFKRTKNTENLDIIKANFVFDSLYSNGYKIFDTALSLAEIYVDLDQPTQAIVWAKKAYRIGLTQNIAPIAKKSIEFILSNQDVKEPELVDHLVQLNREIIQKQYKTKDKLERINRQTQRVYQENNKLKNKLVYLSISLLIIILCSILAFVLLRSRARKKALYNNKMQQQSNEEIYNLMMQKNDIATKAKTTERKRISRELHEGILNNIFTIRFNLQQLGSDNEELKNTLIKELKHLEANTKQIAYSLNDTTLFKDNKFTTLLDELVQAKQQNSAIHLTFNNKKDIDLEYLSAIEKVNIYYIISEALENINKYAYATKAIVTLIQANNKLFIRIQDNGIGIDINQSGKSTCNIKKRVKLLGATLKIMSKKQIGSSLFIILAPTKEYAH